jgi:ElaB/YqjD/DUF883 family membrane-anchored ribosome-binding protein
MDQEPDVIRRQIEATRSDLTEKLENLECQVRGTVQSAKETVQGTIDNVKSTVQETVDTVKRTVDVRYQTGQHPWLMLGGSVAAGFAAGAVLAHVRHAERGVGVTSFTRDGRTQEALTERSSAMAPAASAPVKSEPGLLTQLEHQFHDEIQQVKKVAIGALIGLARDFAKQSWPQLGAQIENVADSVTTKLGGQPVRGPVVDPAWTQSLAFGERARSRSM